MVPALGNTHRLLKLLAKVDGVYYLGLAFLLLLNPTPGTVALLGAPMAFALTTYAVLTISVGLVARVASIRYAIGSLKSDARADFLIGALSATGALLMAAALSLPAIILSGNPIPLAMIAFTIILTIARVWVTTREWDLIAEPRHPEALRQLLHSVRTAFPPGIPFFVTLSVAWWYVTRFPPARTNLLFLALVGVFITWLVWELVVYFLFGRLPSLELVSRYSRRLLLPRRWASITLVVSVAICSILFAILLLLEPSTSVFFYAALVLSYIAAGAMCVRGGSFLQLPSSTGAA